MTARTARKKEGTEGRVVSHHSERTVTVSTHPPLLALLSPTSAARTSPRCRRRRRRRGPGPSPPTASPRSSRALQTTTRGRRSRAARRPSSRSSCRPRPGPGSRRPRATTRAGRNTRARGIEGGGKARGSKRARATSRTAVGVAGDSLPVARRRGRRWVWRLTLSRSRDIEGGGVAGDSLVPSRGAVRGGCVSCCGRAVAHGRRETTTRDELRSESSRSSVHGGRACCGRTGDAGEARR